MHQFKLTTHNVISHHKRDMASKKQKNYNQPKVLHERLIKDADK